MTDFRYSNQGPEPRFDEITQSMAPEEARDFLQLILQNIPDVVFIKDSEFRHIKGNPAFFDLFPEELQSSILGSTGQKKSTLARLTPF
ncbi:MAG: hypothetical protein AAGK17_12100 [Pseudomonadota bacterium]